MSNGRWLFNAAAAAINFGEAISCRGETALASRVGKSHVSKASVFLCDLLRPFIRLQSISQSDFAELLHTAGSA